MSAVPKQAGIQVAICSGVPCEKIAAIGSPVPWIASAMPAQPQVSSSATSAGMMPGRVGVGLLEEVDAVEPHLGGLLDDRPRELLGLVVLVPPPAGSPSRRRRGPSRGSHAARRSARKKPSFALLVGSCRYSTLWYCVRTVSARDVTPQRVIVSMRLRSRRWRLGPAVDSARCRSSGAALKIRKPPNTRARIGLGHVRRRAARPITAPTTPPTAHPGGGVTHDVALAQVRDPADDRGRDDRRQRGALGDGLGEPEADRQDRARTRSPPPIPIVAAQQAGDQPADDRERRRSSSRQRRSSLMPTSDHQDRHADAAAGARGCASAPALRGRRRPRCR